MEQQEFSIGDWLIQPNQHRIRGAGKVTRVEPKVMDVLLCLVDQQGSTVTRDHLLERVWAGTIVTDDVLTRSISELRKAFDDDARNPAVIETIPKIGYRLIPPVNPDYRGDSVPSEIPTVTLSPSSATYGQLSKARPAASSNHLFFRLLLTTGVIVIFCLVMWLFNKNQTTSSRAYQALPLTTYSGHEGPPILSPDGKQVAFSWAGADGDNVDIYVKLVGTETPLRITDSPDRDFMPAWSPDGTRIAYMRRQNQQCHLYVVEALGGASRRMGSCGQNIYGDLTWSPNGKWLAFNDRFADNTPFQLVLVDPESMDRRSLTNPPAGSWGDHDPAFSPDGKQLSFTRSLSEGMQDIYVMSLEDGEELRLTTDSRNINGHTWTASGEEIVFSSNRTGRSGLWRIDVGGGAPVWIGVMGDQAFFPHRGGNRLAYSASSGQTNIWLKSLVDSSEAISLITSTWWDMHPSMSPDGQQIAFTSNRSGTYEIWLANVDGSEQRRLTSFNGPFTSTPRWSPDGSSLVFTSRPGGQADIFILKIDEAQSRRFTSKSSDEMAASWSVDGKWIYFSSNREGEWDVWRRSISGDVTERVTTGGGFGATESTDGFLYFTRNKAVGLWRQPIGGGKEEKVISSLDTRDWGSWAVSESGIYFVSRGRPSVVAFHDLSTDQTDTLFTPAHTVPGMDPALSVSPDGRFILFGQHERSESDLMYVEGFE